MKKLLFICSQNKLRSPTAEQVFSLDDRLEVRSAGLDKDAVNTLSSDDLQWADIIFVMENSHLNKLSKKYSKYLRGKRVITLNNRPMKKLHDNSSELSLYLCCKRTYAR